MDKRIIRIANRFKYIMKSGQAINSLRLMVERAFPGDVYAPDMKPTNTPDEYEGIIDDHFVLYLKYDEKRGNEPYYIKLDIRKDINGATIKHIEFETLGEMVRYYLEHRRDKSEWSKLEGEKGEKPYGEFELGKVGYDILDGAWYEDMNKSINWNRMGGEHYLIFANTNPHKEVYFADVSKKGYHFVSLMGNQYFIPRGQDIPDKPILQAFIKDHPI